MAKAGRKRRLQQRAKAVGAEVERAIRVDAEDRKLEHVASEALFLVDTAGGELTKKQKLEQAQHDPLIAKHKFDAEKASKSELEAVKKLQQKEAQKKKQQQRKEKQETEAPMWGVDGAVVERQASKPVDEFVAPVVVKKTATLKRVASTRHKVKKVEVPAAGQSYNPDFADHQNVLAEAVAVEVEREEKMKEKLKPLAQGLSEETLQYINDKDSDEEEESDENENAADGQNEAAAKHVNKEKVTKSQRNRRARHKLMETEHKVRRQEKSIIKQINTAKHILDDIVKQEKVSAKKQEQKKELAEKKLEEEPLVRVSGKFTKLDRSVPVLLSDELTGSLRTIRPKGNPLLDRFDSMHKRNLIEVNHSRGRAKRKVKIIEAKK